MKHAKFVIPTRSAHHLLSGAKPSLSKSTRIITPTPNKEGLYHFPDGEAYLRIPGLKRAQHIVILHSGYPDPNGGLIELYMMLDIIGAYAPKAKIDVVFACMPYARQDNAYYDGELNMAQTIILTLIKRYDVRHIWTIDAHFAHEKWVRGLPLTNITAYTNLLMSEASGDHPGIIFMAPDAGSSRRTHLKGAKKKRKNSYNVTLDLDQRFAHVVEGQIIGVVDDLLSTGTTLERFYQKVKGYGAREVYTLITHGVNPSGIERTLSLYDGLYMTNTVDSPHANVPINEHIWLMIERNLE